MTPSKRNIIRRRCCSQLAIVENTHNSITSKIKRLSNLRETPFLVMEKQSIRDRYRMFRQALPEVEIFYAVKANPHRQIIKLLRDESCGFEVSSKRELQLVLDCGVPSDRIISSNPIKSVSFIEKAYQAGVRHFAFDSDDEIDKLARYAPGSRAYIRLTVPNDDSEWPLARKFGVESEEAARLLLRARECSLIPVGITFHVGSQCASRNAWVNAIKKCGQVRDLVKSNGLKIEMLNIGGGFPIEHAGLVPSIPEIGQTVTKALYAEFPDNPQISAEPGRALVGEAGTLVCRVNGKAVRNGDNWLYLDAGVFNGLMESLGGIKYTMRTDRGSPVSRWVVAGPSCDSMDCIADDVYLPDLAIGDIVYIWPAGAYTTAYASHFNGISIPQTYFV